MPPLYTGNHEIEVSFHVDNKHEERDFVPLPITFSSNADFRNEEKALDMTLKHMKFQIEFLEDQRQKMALKCISQASTIETLKKDSELKQVKIGMLQELFRSLNSEGHSSCQALETAAVTKPALEETNSESCLTTLKSMIISICRLEKMNSAPVLSTTAEEAEVLSSLEGTSIDPDSTNARRMEIKIGDLEGQYNGPLRNSIPHGSGTIRFRNGDTYLGELVDGEMHGNGTLYHRSKDSGISRGYFEHNNFVGVEREGPLRMRR
jgi:hypothetical protein